MEAERSNGNSEKWVYRMEEEKGKKDGRWWKSVNEWGNLTTNKSNKETNRKLGIRNTNREREMNKMTREMHRE